jgi:hypothetical protein
MATLVLGIITSILGLGLLYWMGRRKFNRTTPFGTQGFSNYNQRLAIPFLERLGRIAGRLLLILGILFLLSYYWQRSRKNPKQTKDKSQVSLYVLAEPANKFS